MMNTSKNIQHINEDAKSFHRDAKAVSSNLKYDYLDSNQVDLSAMLR